VVYREVSVIEVREVLRVWLAGHGVRRTAELAGVDRKTVRRYVEAAQAAGLTQQSALDAVDDGLVGAVVSSCRPGRPGGFGTAWDALCAREEQIRAWVRGGLTTVKIGDLLAREGTAVPYRTLARFVAERCEGGRSRATVRVDDGEPGAECQLDFARMGLVPDPGAGRRRLAHALIFTAVFSRHMFVYFTFAQTLEAVLAGCEQAWQFFGGVFRVLIPDNLSPVVAAADPVHPRFTVGWLDYAQARGFVTDPARVATPTDKPRVERNVTYVRGSLFAGEAFVDLADAQARARVWCSQTAGLRRHGTTQARPAEVFAEQEASRLLPAPTARYVVPIYDTVTVHRDHHIKIGKALYSLPTHLIGQQVQVRADTELVKVFHRGQLVKTHPRQPPGGRSTDRADLPAKAARYAARDVASLREKAAAHGAAVGGYAARLLDVPLPWTRMRAVYRLLGLVRRHGADTVDAACAKTLDIDVVDVNRIARICEAGLAHPAAGAQPRVVVPAAARFARPAGEYAATLPERTS
jgi:transposase